MKFFFSSILVLVWSTAILAQVASVSSPDKQISVVVNAPKEFVSDTWFLQVNYNNNGTTPIIPVMNLGLMRNDQDFSKDLQFIKTGKARLISSNYSTLHGKRSRCTNSANEITVVFQNPWSAKLNVIIRAYNDGIAFRYEFPEKDGKYVVKDELTSYFIPDSTKRWLEKYNPANEGLYSEMKDGSIQNDWCYPALFSTLDSACWFLIHEADVNRNYCGSKLTNYGDKNSYKITFPDEWNGRGTGEVLPTISLPWKSPWRLVIIGGLNDVVESTLVDDVSTPSVINNTKWIKPGVASWNYWSDNHGTRDYQTVCKFADLAADMGWDYTLLDWEWDTMGNGGKLEDALKYIHSLGVKPLMWYNSGGEHTWVGATPKGRMLTHENRMKEFAKLKKLGVAGVKVDFFESEKQNMINYYLDILEDAAKFEMMVYFHGCLVPRGWQRTYPHLMTYEGVRGAEWYNNGSEFTATAPAHNATLPFTRNVVGSMDYTPVTFTNSQYPHLTSYGHELALSVLFESGIQHMADRPEGYYELPDAAGSFLKIVPNTWDDTKLLSGYPGEYVVMARKKGNQWYIGGISGLQKERVQNINFSFLPEKVKYKLTLISDGRHDKSFSVKHMVVDNTSHLDVKMLRRGGFSAVLNPIDN